MISFEKFYLDNGLEVIVHEDPATSVVCLNTLYKVGSRNEEAHKTGFAHLFEHLMFGGSKNVDNFDTPLQAVGGENNAFTNTDLTNYYTTVPSNNVETAFWLESDRMLSLSFNPEVLEVQRNVVIEEFKQRYLNQPYGDTWHLIRPAAYESHTYQWPTIGKEISHIENATMDDVKSFFNRYYHPANAILVIAGDITLAKARELTEKWYGSIPMQKTNPLIPVTELPQKARRVIDVEKEVPSSMIYKCFHMSGRADIRYTSTDLMSDIIGRGKSSILHQKLVKEQTLFSQLNAYVLGSLDPGLFVIQGQLNPDTPMEAADDAINKVVASFDGSKVSAGLEKVKNLAVSSVVFGEAELLNRAMNLAFASFMGETEDINHEVEKIERVSTEEILARKEEVLRPENETVLFYNSN